MSTALQAVTTYPFNLDGPLCPLLNHAELLGEFYAEDGLRHGIKSFCKKAVWPGKPVVPFVISPENLKGLLLSLFNTPAARASLQRLAEADKATYLDNAIWEWCIRTNPKLAERILGCCQEVKEKSFLKPEALEKFLSDFQKESPDANVVAQLAHVVLAFAMLQPDERYRLGEIFLFAFPAFAEGFGAFKATTLG